MKWLSVFLLVISAPACMAHGSESASLRGVSDCKNVSASAQVDDCIRRERLNSEIALVEGVVQFEADARELYEADPVLGEQLIETVVEAQQVWAVFRDANCKVEAFEAEEGTPLQQSLVSSCVARMNAERTEYLGKLLR